MLLCVHASINTLNQQHVWGVWLAPTLQEKQVQVNGARCRLFQSMPRLQQRDDLSALLVLVRPRPKGEDLPNGHPKAPDIRLVGVLLTTNTFRGKPAKGDLGVYKVR